MTPNPDNPMMSDVSIGSTNSQFGPWEVVPNDWQCKPYKFAVVGADRKPVAFTVTREMGENYAKQMNTKGYIEP